MGRALMLPNSLCDEARKPSEKLDDPGHIERDLFEQPQLRLSIGGDRSAIRPDPAHRLHGR